MPYADPDNKPESKGPYQPGNNAATGPTSNNNSNRSRKAGEKVRKLQDRINAAKESGDTALVQQLRGKREKVENRIYGDGTGNIADAFDAAAGGAGSKKGTSRVSRQDLRELEERYGKQATVDYMKSLEGNDAVNTQGGKAQKLLATYKSELTESPVNPDQPDPGKPDEGTTTPPEDTTTPPEDTTTPPEDTTTPPGNTTTPPEGTTTTPAPTDDNEQSEGTLGGGGIDASVGDNANAETGGVVGGVNNTGGNNDIDGDGNAIGAGAIGGNNASGNDNSVSVNGDNNNVYGGSQNNMSIVYGEGSNPGNTAAVSDLTTMGLGKADDSPAAQMGYVSRYQTANAQAQERYKDVGTDTAYKYIQNAAATNPIDYQKLNEQISGSIQNHYDNALIQSNYYMGDGYNYVPPTYKMPDPPKPIESNVGDIADDAKDDIEAVE